MDVMMNMTTEDVKYLQGKFTGSLTLEAFVELMRTTLQDRIQSELDFVAGVIDLFHTIDVNGDKTLDWDEFASYMMDAGLAKADFLFDDRPSAYVSLALAPRDLKTPMNKIKTHVQQLLYMADCGAMAYFEFQSDVVYVYTLHFDQNEAPRHTSTIRLHTAFQEHEVICTEYVPEKRLIAISSVLDMGYISLWSIEELRSPRMIHRFELTHPQELLHWIASCQVLVSSSGLFPAISKRQDSYRPNRTLQHTKMNVLRGWNLSSMIPVEDLSVGARMKGVSALSSLTTRINTFLLVGRDDGVLVLFNAENGEELGTIDAHGNGVKTIASSRDLELFATVGQYSYCDETTQHIRVWNLHSAKLLRNATIKSHEAPVHSVLFVEDKRQLLSVDASGVFLVHSLEKSTRNWECVQKFRCAAQNGSLVATFFVVPESANSDAVLVAGGKEISFFDNCVIREREDVFYSYYCQDLNIILGATSNKLLFWGADNGKLWKIYEYSSMISSGPSHGKGEHSCKASITAVCMDDRERKVIIGDDTGSIKVINAVNGNVMKVLDPHNHAITHIHYGLQSKRVLSISVDSVLHVYDENNPHGFYLPFGGAAPQSVLLQSLRFAPENGADDATHQREAQLVRRPSSKIESGKYEIVKGIMNQELDLVAVLVSGNRGESFIQLWNCEMTHAAGTCMVPHGCEISCLNFFGSSAEIVGGTSNGRMFLWTLTREEPGYARSLELVHNADGDVDECVQSSVMLHVATVPVDSSASNGPSTSSKRPTTTSHDSHSIASRLFQKSHTIEERIRREGDGMNVFGGDDAGYVTRWFVKRRQHGAQFTFAVATAVKRTDGSREKKSSFQHEETVMGFTTMSSLYRTALLKSDSMVEADPTSCATASTLQCLARWKAHSGPILSMTFGRDPMVIITSSSRGKVKVWDFDGQLYGILDYYATRRHPTTRKWAFPVDMNAKVVQKQVEAEGLLEQLRLSRSEEHAQAHRTRSMSVLQQRLSLTTHELSVADSANARKRRNGGHWNRLSVRRSDIGRAIRTHLLSQAQTTHKGNQSATLTREPSLHTLLTELNSLDAPSDAKKTPVNTSRRKKYSMITLSDIKSQRSRSASVYCDATAPVAVAPMPTRANSMLKLPTPKEEIVVMTSDSQSSRRERLDYSDFRQESARLDSARAAGAQAPFGAVVTTSDSRLKYHVRLAHSWQYYPHNL
ncbi:TPA: hypothetical protein N0F65_012391 [Lagenidium giganteum]|uniref:EF-hand domain-containing protein n=1 Tax=Lagenidium giganteum TaxID=4803 RepID=A0AAV2YRZ4_9STRA|nr:TPA: hypothetical protein N0F65_012391 [Lagenidium giganteum]